MRDAGYRARDAASKRRKRDAVAFRQGGKCRARLGPHAVCGGRLLEDVDRLGRVVVRCPLCERKRAGVCRLCPRAVNGRRGWAVYCVECKRTQSLPAQRRRWIAKPYNMRRKLALNRAWRKKRKRAGQGCGPTQGGIG